MIHFPEPRAAYLHVPFCVHRCGYCDFTLVAGRDDLIGAYLDALETDLRTLEEPRTVETLFLGGGTPTHLPTGDLARLLELCRRWFRLADGYEWSVEANPAGLDAGKVAVLADAGVNRVSLGVQSFDADVLAVLERDHRRDTARQAIECVRSRIGNLSLDLIFGVPGQSLDLWRDTLREAVALGPTHLSTYGLTIEKGTAFWTRREKGRLVPLPEETERAMYAAAMDQLAAAGYVQYEVSNFARPGYRCRHNETYWKALPYYGFGPGAARYRNGRREINHRSTTTWLRRIRAGESPIAEAEQLSDEDRAREALVLALRMTDGVACEAFQQRFGVHPEDLAGEAIARHCAAGLLEAADDHLRLTREGRFVADAVIVDLL